MESVNTIESQRLYGLIGKLSQFLRNKDALHHPNKPQLVREAKALLDECFDCKRAVYNGQSDIHIKVDNIEARIHKISQEVVSYQEELNKIVAILRNA